MWLVNKLALWKGLELETTNLYSGGAPIKASIGRVETGAIGFLEVFDDYDLALKEAGDAKLIREIKYKEGVK